MDYDMVKSDMINQLWNIYNAFGYKLGYSDPTVNALLLVLENDE